MPGGGTLGLALLLALMLAAGAARAGRPLGGDDGGFVPPSKRVARCEDTVAKILRKDAACLDRCTYKAARAAFFKGAPFEDEPCEQACGDAAERKYDRTIAKLTGCPNCLDATALKTQIGTNADVGNGLIYCASPSGAFVGEVRGAVHGRRGR